MFAHVHAVFTSASLSTLCVLLPVKHALPADIIRLVYGLITRALL